LPGDVQVHKSSDQQAIQQAEVTANQRTLNVVPLLIVDLGGTTMAAAMVAGGNMQSRNLALCHC
jgi:hypothetical protein